MSRESNDDPDAGCPGRSHAYALRASGLGFETVSSLIERGLADARLQRLANPRVDVVPRRANEKAK